MTYQSIFHQGMASDLKTALHVVLKWAEVKIDNFQQMVLSDVKYGMNREGANNIQISRKGIPEY